jgi:hypothetical protein
LPGQDPSGANLPPPAFRALLISANQATDAQLAAARQAGYNAIVLELRGTHEAEINAERAAAQMLGRCGLALYYWIEIGRCPELAAQQPRWQGSLQGHQEWRRLFPDFPQPGKDEVVKCHPWVPVLYQEAFEAHLTRVRQLLADKPAPEGVLLNDLQGVPSACGCGNILCRWTTDYGPIRTATPAGDDAAAKFVSAVARLAPKAKVIPVWTTECEAPDVAKHGPCAGVGCFEGICWRAYTKQLMPLTDAVPLIGVLVPYRQFERDQPRYGPTAGWIKHALASFAEMPPKRGGKAIAAERLIPVLQGWDAGDEQRAAQIARATEARATGYVMALTKIEQSWEPQLVKIK